MQLKRISLTVLLVAVYLLVQVFPFAYAQDVLVDALKEKIQTKSTDLQKIKEEINQYQKELDTTNVKARSLSDDIKVLTDTKKKLDTDITKTQKNIELTSATIQELESGIREKESQITLNVEVIQKMLRNLQQESNGTLVEAFLSNRSLSSIGEYLDHTEKFQEKIHNQIEELYSLKDELATRKTGAETKKKDLSTLKTELGDKKQAVQQTQKEKDKLLMQTKSEQANYQKILAEKIRLKEQFERELYAYESELKLSVDKTKLPTIGSVLQWPLDSIRITQYFGATVDAKRLYVSGSHNGIDLGATDGTKVKAALSGTVWATGNTDLKAGCYSYGKWVVINHGNGLSTLYSHLSAISVTEGSAVTTGDTVGFSGRTGYVTGPHLHFSVLATEGTRIMTIPPERTTNCRGVVMPIADPTAYLDPIQYLPPAY